mgnify:CR=1 FL=1
MLGRSEFIPSKEDFFEFLKVRFSTVGLNFDEIKSHLDAALEVSEQRFILNKSKFYTSSDGLRAQFSATHYSSHALLLYQIARECYLSGRKDLAEKVYFLNVATTATDLYYEVELPIRTGCEHPLGTVIGRASFSRESSLFFYNQNLIGGNFKTEGQTIYPNIEGNLYMFPRSSLVGDVTVEGSVILGNSTYVKDAGLLCDVIVFGSSPKLTFKSLKSDSRLIHNFLTN